MALEKYDEEGKYREVDQNGHPLTSDLELFGRPITGPAELASAVAASEEYQACVAEKVLSFALSRGPFQNETCLASRLTRKPDGVGHHAYAHHGNDGARIESLRRINRVQVGLLADLLKRLDERALLDDTLVLYGSDMSDGDKHHTENLPVLLCGGGSDLKLGEVVGLSLGVLR